MGNLYRFVEPVLLFLLKRKGRSHGYDLLHELHEYALTDSEVEIAALYRTLRQLESNGCVSSEWNMDTGGPARRLYVLTPHGERHLEEWLTVLGHMSKSMNRLITDAHAALADSGTAPTARRKVS
jgi:PadR family transcriptional regulator PadR